MEEVSSSTNGVKPIPIQGRLRIEKERLMGMTDEERRMRVQWVRDQHLAPHEPVYVPEIEKELINPIRRFYRYPLDKVFAYLKPTLGSSTPTARILTGKIFMGLFGVYATIYYVKYRMNDWTTISGWRLKGNRPTCLPGDPGYPFVSTKQPQDYATFGFENSPL